MSSEITVCQEDCFCCTADEEGAAGLTAAAACRAPGLHKESLSTRSRRRGAAAEE